VTHGKTYQRRRAWPRADIRKPRRHAYQRGAIREQQQTRRLAAATRGRNTPGCHRSSRLSHRTIFGGMAAYIFCHYMCAARISISETSGSRRAGSS